jgi:uncharacterized protein (TIGR02996 family)
MSPDVLELAFAHDALAQPGNLAVRMAYADWLAERGDPRGELLQLRCRLLADPSLVEQERALSQRPGLVWMDRQGLPLTKELFLALFRRSMAEAAAWHRAWPALRPVPLKPLVGMDDRGFDHHRRPMRPRIVQMALAGRTTLLSINHVRISDRPPAGRLLYFWPDNTLDDEAAMAESNYFLSDNSPPWEKWVWFQDEDFPGPPPANSYWKYPLLVSWVPPEYVAAVQRGINVNPEECILWADDVDIELTRVLREAGLLS